MNNNIRLGQILGQIFSKNGLFFIKSVIILLHRKTPETTEYKHYPACFRGSSKSGVEGSRTPVFIC